MFKYTKQQSLGFRFAKLVFRHSVWGSLHHLKQTALISTVLGTFILCLLLSQKDPFLFPGAHKKRYMIEKLFGIFQTWWQGISFSPYVVKSWVNEPDTIINTPEQRSQTCLFHVNMLNLFRSREEDLEDSHQKKKLPEPAPTASVYLGSVSADHGGGLKLCNTQQCGILPS